MPPGMSSPPGRRLVEPEPARPARAAAAPGRRVCLWTSRFHTREACATRGTARVYGGDRRARTRPRRGSAGASKRLVLVEPARRLASAPPASSLSRNARTLAARLPRPGRRGAVERLMPRAGRAESGTALASRATLEPDPERPIPCLAATVPSPVAPFAFFGRARAVAHRRARARPARAESGKARPGASLKPDPRAPGPARPSFA